MFSALLQGLSRQVPSVCRVCRAWPSHPVCEECVHAFAQPAHRCAVCALTIPDTLRLCRACTTAPPEFHAALTAVDYDYPWDRLIADFKFQGNPAWARHFATVLRSAPWVEPALEAADWVIPMPLARKRLLERGFNQSALLARHLSPARVQEDCLLRLFHTPPQSGLSREERQRNLQHAFALEPHCAGRVQGKTIILVDDVMTSGATMAAASVVLRRAGAKHITALVFARTPRGDARA